MRVGVILGIVVMTAAGWQAGLANPVSELSLVLASLSLYELMSGMSKMMPP